MLNWLFRKAPTEPIAPPKSKASVFSTHIDYDPSDKHSNIRAVLGRLTDLINKSQPRPVNAKGEAVAMDSADDGTQFKNQFALSQPNIPDALLFWYASQNFIGHQMCAILAQHWLIDKVCSMPARDAIRQGYTIESDGSDLDDETIKAIKKCDKRYRLDKNMEQFLRFGRIFGVRVAFFKIEYPGQPDDYYELPFNIDSVTLGSYKGIVQVDPYWAAPMLDQDASSRPDTMHFYEPTWWMINGKRYHRSHLIIFRNSDLPDMLKPTYQYGGVPIPQRIMERVYAAERTANEGPLLAMTKRTTVLKVDLDKAFANKAEFDQRMQDWIATRDNQQVKLIGESDELEQHDTALADLDAVIMTQYQIVAAAGDVPATKLLGTTPKGFNSTGDYEEASYHEMLESLQTHDLTPFIERHHDLVMKSDIGKKIQLTVSWNPLDSPTALEYAQINLAKAQAGAALVESGAIDGGDERERLIADKNSDYPGLVGYAGNTAGFDPDLDPADPPTPPDAADPKAKRSGGTLNPAAL